MHNVQNRDRDIASISARDSTNASNKDITSARDSTRELEIIEKFCRPHHL